MFLITNSWIEPIKKGTTYRHPLYKAGGRAVSNRRPPEPQSGALTN